jgi:putative ABC transport system permease protein
VKTFMQDLRYGGRMLRKSPAFTLVATITLALGIGANTAIFSVVNAVLLDPFPYKDHSRLVLAQQSLPKIGMQQQGRLSGPEFADLKNQSQIFEQVAAWEPVSRNITGGDGPERVFAAKVSTDFFQMLGVNPMLGRTIAPEEQGAKGERVLVISYALWQRRLGGTPDVLGQKVALDDEPFTVIGVMPPRFRHDGADAWFPFLIDLETMPRNFRTFMVTARLKPGLSFEQARAELNTVAARLEQDFTKTNPEYEGRGLSFLTLLEFYLGSVRHALLILLGAVGLVLLIACANIANLLLARAVARDKEIAIRTAMGASRRRIIRQFLTESLLLAVTGGGLGLLLASWGIDWLVKLAPEGSLPQGVEAGINGRVLIFTMAISILTAVIFGLWPALQSSRMTLTEAMKEAGPRSTMGRGGSRSQSMLVVSEIALSLLLLVMAGLMIQSFARLTRVSPGFNPEGVMTMRMNLPPARYNENAKKAAFFEQLIERVEKVPGIQSVGVASHTPFVFTENTIFTIEGAADSSMSTQSLDTRTVSPGYFRTMGIPLVAGQEFTAQDRAGAPLVAIINRTMANRFWPDQDPLGKRLKNGRPDSKSPWATVIGVVEDSAQASLDVPIRPEINFSLAQNAGSYRRMNLLVRTKGNPLAFKDLIEAEVREVDKDQPVYQVQTMNELIGITVATRRFAMFLLGLFAGLALLLAAVGIYGVMSYSVTQRTHEIGIRMALGASSRDVMRLIVGRGLALVAAGAAVGLGGAYAATRLMATLLYEVSATDPLTFAAVTAGLTIVAMLACYIPARRATRVDPMVALRYE